MKYIFTHHAKLRMLQRNINEETVKHAIETADLMDIRHGDEIEVIKYFTDKRLKVIYTQTKNIINIITVYWIIK